MPPPPADQSAIVRFHKGEGPDDRGRMLDAILAWDDDRLEAVHDYIQWLFPLDEPSRFNPSAPLLTPADRAAFRHPALAANLRRALDRMLAFYGFALQPTTPPQVARADDWRDRFSVWLYAGNHNLLRLTRIIRSLTLLGQPELARALYDGLHKECAGRVSSVTLEYWKEATDADA